MDKVLFFDPVAGIYAYTTNTLLALRQKALMNAYQCASRSYNRYKISIIMAFEVNNRRRFKGLKPLRKRTYKRIKGS